MLETGSLMNQLQKAIIEKIGHDFGFEYVVLETDSAVVLGSARHLIHASITIVTEYFQVRLLNVKPLLTQELSRGFESTNAEFLCKSDDDLARVLKRTSQLASALPNQAADNYEQALQSALDHLPVSIRGTEVERMVRQRVGQNAYRQAMLDYWGNACAVTGLQMPEILRASHAKPWADCASDAERLDVFNGFLLSANLDALFDRFLISFDDSGKILLSPKISIPDRKTLGLNESMQLRWLADAHIPYLKHHREHLKLEQI